MEHPALVVSVPKGEGGEFEVLLIDTRRDGVPHAYELTREQERDAGVHGVFRTRSCRQIAFRAELLNRSGRIQVKEALEIEVVVARAVDINPTTCGQKTAKP